MEEKIKISPTDYAAIYARKSIKTENNSIETQISLAKDLLFEKKLLLYNIYRDEESATKFTYDKRKEFSQLMKDAESGKFKTLVVYRRDRLARKYEQFLEIKRFFKNLGVKILYTNDVDLYESDNYISDFIENIIVAIAEFEPKIVAERTAMGKQKKRERREYVSGKNIPHGYMRIIDDETKKTLKYIPDKDKSKMVKSIFAKYVSSENDYTIRDIVNELKKNYMPSDTFKLKYQSIYNIIKNPIYAGLQFVDENNTIDNLFEKEDINTLNLNNNTLLQSCSNVDPIIDENIWYIAIKKWRSNYSPKKTKQPNHLRGLLICEKCKTNIILSGNYYRCKSKGCFHVKKNELINPLLDTIINDTITTDKVKKDIHSRITVLTENINIEKKSIKSLQSQQRNCLIKYVNNPNDCNLKNTVTELIDSETDSHKKIDDYNKEIEHLKKCITSISFINKLENKETIVNYIKEDMNNSQNLVYALIKKVTLSGENIDSPSIEVQYGY